MIPVLAALIFNHDNSVLLAQRKPGKTNALKWEFPGGKLLSGETPESCLAREIEEELGLKISVGQLFSAVNYSYTHANILLLAYFAELVEGRIVLTDHINVRWVSIEKLLTFDLSPADIPIVEKLMENFRGTIP
ncbi:MAG: (deoxy)nucleoside triphosphate pyrophosphohydrolase [Calditrichaeota bacterium]|nr:(deoxy)nucleoside triphosphate pyrophosphohydrolase [Calditrichota bacterium]